MYLREGSRDAVTSNGSLALRGIVSGAPEALRIIRWQASMKLDFDLVSVRTDV